MIAVYGTVCLDRLRRVKALPEPGGYVEILSDDEFLGGEAVNTALALAQWGCPAKLFGNPIARDDLRDLILSHVHYDFPLGPATTPFCDVYVTDDGDRTMFGWGFAPLAERMRGWEPDFEGAKVVTLDPNHGVAAVSLMHQIARRGGRVYLQDVIDPADIPAGSVVQTSTDWLGVRGDAQANREAARVLAEASSSTVVLTDGAHGLVFAPPSADAVNMPAYPITRVVDSTGAGDVFRAGVLQGIEAGWPVGRCLAFGAAAGALNCLSLGANAGIPQRDRVDQLIREHQAITQQYDELTGTFFA
jgi:sugar/nucleoside kinase (ribokinase family)